MIDKMPTYPDITYRTSARARRLSIRIRHDRSIIVTIPRWISMRQAHRFVGEHDGWIQKILSKLPENTRPLTTDEIKQLKERAYILLPLRTRELARLHNIIFSHVTIRHQKSRWGSCSSKHNINLNCELMRLPPHVRDYVILHELAHVLHKHHGKAFWEYLDTLCSGAKQMNKQLKRYTLGYVHTNRER